MNRGEKQPQDGKGGKGAKGGKGDGGDGDGGKGKGKGGALAGVAAAQKASSKGGDDADGKLRALAEESAHTYACLRRKEEIDVHARLLESEQQRLQHRQRMKAFLSL
eukprot:gene46538-58926_t